MLWFLWLLATGGAGALIGYMAPPTDFFWELVASGFVVGIAQWLVLRRYINSAVWWIPVSGFGWIFGIYLSIFTNGILDQLVESLTSVGGLWEVFWLNVTYQPINFAVFGFAQWLMLRRHFRYAYWWILASVLSGVARGAVGSYVAAVVQIGGGTISNAAGWAASGAITGIVLVWLINNHRKNQLSV